MSFRVFCDLCKQKIKRNMVSERLIVECGGFIAEVVISKNRVEGDGDLCYDCLLKMLNKRKYVRKPKADIQTIDRHAFTAPEPLSDEARKILTGSRKEMMDDATKPRKKRGKQAPQSEETPGDVDAAPHCSKCGMVTTTLVDGKPLCMICQTK